VSKRSKREAARPPPKPPLLWTGVLFALAANLLLVTLADLLHRGLPGGLPAPTILIVVIAPLLAGILTERYTRHRGAMHAFVGGMASIPLLALYVLPGGWSLAILAGAFCTLGGALMELRSRGVQRET
jgi:hypothetical protein